MDCGLVAIQPQTGLTADLHEKLRQRAKRNHRSLKGEIVSIVEAALLRDEKPQEQSQEGIAS